MPTHARYITAVAQGIALASFALAIAVCSSARADVSAQVYDDARAIVEELISDEAARNIVPLAMCVAPDVNKYFPRSLERIYNQQFGGLRTTIQEETSYAIAYVIYREIAQAQAGSAPVEREALLGVPLNAQAPDPEKFSDGYQMLAPSKVDDVSNPALVAGDAPVTSANLEACKKAAQIELETGAYPRGKTIQDLFDEACLDPTADARTAYACSIAQAAQSLLMEDVAHAQEHLVHAISAVFAAALPPTGGSFAQTYEAVAKVLSAHLDGAPVDFVEALAQAGVDRAAAEALKGSVQRVVAQWRLVVSRDGKSLDFAAFVRTLNGSQGVLTALCGAGPFAQAPVCGYVARASKQLVVGQKVWKLVRTISNKQYRDAAIAVIRDIFPISKRCTSDEYASEDACLLRRELRGFSENLVSYVADLSDDGNVAATTSVAFRSSAVDLIRSLGVGGGIDRTYGSRLIAPQFTLGYSWSSGYVEQVGSNGTRLTVSIDWLNVRFFHRRTPLVYFDTRVWLLDALGPFSELAMRKIGSYERSEAAWLNFIRPKLAFNLASPALSTHLVATLSIAVRPAAAFEDADGNLGYTFLWNDKTDTDDDWARFLELGVALGYLL